MSEENKTEKTAHTVGKGTPGSRLKSLFRKSGRGLTLKQFVKDLKKSNPDVQVWLDNKKGKNEQPRAAHNITRANLERQATKLAKRAKTKPGGKSSAPTK